MPRSDVLRVVQQERLRRAERDRAHQAAQDRRLPQARGVHGRGGARSPVGSAPAPSGLEAVPRDGWQARRDRGAARRGRRRLRHHDPASGARPSFSPLGPGAPLHHDQEPPGADRRRERGMGLLLRKWKAQRAAEKLAFGAAYIDEGWIRAEPDGSRISPDTLSARFKARERDAGVRHRGLHSVRHTSAERRLKAGVRLDVVSNSVTPRWRSRPTCTGTRTRRR